MMDENKRHVNRTIRLGQTWKAATILTLLTAPLAIFAQTSLEEVGTAAGLSGGPGLTEIIGNVISIFLGLLGVIFLILVIYAGFLWMTSQGNEEKIKIAKAILKNATIGLVLTLAAYGITSFVISMLLQATGLGGDETRDEAGLELFSDALGSGAIKDHYPPRNGTDIPRNTKILVTFKSAMHIPSFVVGYDTAGTSEDTSDDTVPSSLLLNMDNVTVSCLETDDTKTTYQSSEITVSFTDDLETFVFDPPILGSSDGPAICTVALGEDILDADGGEIFTGRSSNGYRWSFETSTELDLTPPRVGSVIPEDDSTYGRNITVQVTFSEAMDPTTVSGTYITGTGGFTDLQILSDEDEDGTWSPVAGSFVVSSGYTVVEFTSTDACGINSCNQTVYCLPGPGSGETTEEARIYATAATLSSSPPEAAAPYDGVVDVAGNSLDGDSDGVAEGPPSGAADTDHDNFTSDFNVTDEIVLDAPVIEEVTPAVLEGDVALDQDVVVLWDTLMRSGTLTNEIISLLSDPDHEMSYVTRTANLDNQTELTIRHGVFMESVEDDITTTEDETVSYLYVPILPEEIQSLYQNCYSPAQGPGEDPGETCDADDDERFCCNGDPSAQGFDASSFTCQP